MKVLNRGKTFIGNKEKVIKIMINTSTASFGFPFGGGGGTPIAKKIKMK